MHVTRIDKAQPYSAPEHDKMQMLRLQGKEASDLSSMWVGLSHLSPGGGTSLKASAQEKFYLVLSGEVTFSDGHSEETLGPMDSCVFLANESRRLENRTGEPASVLLVMQETPA